MANKKKAPNREVTCVGMVTFLAIKGLLREPTVEPFPPLSSLRLRNKIDGFTFLIINL